MKWWVKALLESAGFIILVTIIGQMKKGKAADRVEEVKKEQTNNTYAAPIKNNTNNNESVNSIYDDAHDKTTSINDYVDHEKESATHLYCRKCGKEISLDSDFCCYCGAEVIHRKA